MTHKTPRKPILLSIVAMAAAAVFTLLAHASIDANARMDKVNAMLSLPTSSVKVKDLDKAKFIAHTRHMSGDEGIWQATGLAFLVFEAGSHNDNELIGRLHHLIDEPNLDSAEQVLSGAVVELLRENGYRLSYPTQDAEALVVALRSDSLDQFFNQRLPR